ANKERGGRFRRPPDGAEVGLRQCHQRIGFPIAGEGKRRIRRENIGQLEPAEQGEQYQPVGVPAHGPAPYCPYRLRRGADRNSGRDVLNTTLDRVSQSALRFGTSFAEYAPPATINKRLNFGLVSELTAEFSL